MKTVPTYRLRSAFLWLISGLVVTAAVQATPFFNTDFGTDDGYTTGWLGNNANWTVNATEEEGSPFYIVSNGGPHPASPSGTNMLWINPNTQNTSGTSGNPRRATLTFAQTPIRESFSFSMDIYASSTGGAGQTATFYLANANATTAGSAPRFSFSSASTTSFNLNVWNSGSATSANVTLPKASWLRIELNVVASSSSSTGTYGFTVYQLDSTGSVTSTLYSSGIETYGYTLSDGFNSFQYMVNSTRMDYWVDNITVSSIPEPRSAALLGGLAGLLALCLRRR